MTATKHLTTGWEPDLPVADSLLRRFLFSWAGVCDAFARAAGGRTAATTRFALADYGRPSGWFNCATLLQPPDASGFDEVVDNIENLFARESGDCLLLSAWPTPDLQDRGWRLVGHPPLLVRPPGAVLAPPAPPAVELVQVEDGDTLAQWEQVAIEGYPLPELCPPVPGALAAGALLDDPRLLFTLGREAGRPVSIGALFSDYGVGCFTLGVTRTEARGRGHWRAHAIRRINAHPGLWMTGLFSDDSRPLAEGLGFIPVLRFTLWSRTRPA